MLVSDRTFFRDLPLIPPAMTTNINMLPQAPVVIRSIGSIVAGLTFVFVSVDVTLALTKTILPVIAQGTGHVEWSAVFNLRNLLMVGGATGITAWSLITHSALHIDEASMSRQESRQCFLLYLKWLSYVVLLVGVLIIVAIVGLAQVGYLEDVLGVHRDASSATDGGDPDQRKKVLQGVLLLMSLPMTLFGALFFFAKSLWEKAEDSKELFERNKFWAGLWFRLGEALVFTIAIFLILRYETSRGAGSSVAKELIGFMPMIGLLIGMSVKSFEALMFGISERILAGVRGVISESRRRGSHT